MLRTYTSVSRYIQGPGALNKLGSLSLDWGKQPLIITDTIMKNLLGEQLQAGFDKAGAPINLLTFPGEVTRSTIDKLTAQAKELNTDVIIGLGGGKALDTAKGVALALGCNMISVPTIAATDAPASFAIAVYDDNHFLTEILKMPRNPDLLLVDTTVICGAPTRFLVAGIGDAISKKFEVEACTRSGSEMLMGGLSTHTGRAIANTCYDLIREHALPAIAAAKTGKPNEHVEALIEATVLLSTLAFENGGLSVSHAIAKGLPMVKRAAGTLHGEHVGYGLLVQLVLENRDSAFIQELMAFYKQLQLPYRLEQLGISNVTEEELQTIADNAMTSPSVKRFDQTLDNLQLQSAIKQVEALSY
ncbi:MAG: glycerol dehydrogenase [Spongiibacteraceae bacterium]